MVPDGVEEVELAKINLEQRERERKLLLDDIRSLAGTGDSHIDHLSAEKDNSFWMINSGKASLVIFQNFVWPVPNKKCIFLWCLYHYNNIKVLLCLVANLHILAELLHVSMVVINI